MRMNQGRSLSLLVLVLSLFTASNGQVVSINVVGEPNVMEGDSISVCVTVVSEPGLIEATDSVQLMTRDGGAIGDSDFQPLDVTVLLISALEGGECFDIMTINDTAVEGIEAFSVSLSDAMGVTVVNPEVIISISDDNDMVEVDFQSTSFIGTEGESITVCVVITSGSVELFGFVNVDFMTADITATSPEDYPVIRSINIPIGTDEGDSVCQNVPLIFDDRVEEDEETFSIKLINPPDEVQYVITNNATAIVTIRDTDMGRVEITSDNSVSEGDSGPTTFTIVIALQTESVALGRDVAYTVQLTPGTATAGSDFGAVNPTEVTFNTGDNNGASRMVTVPIIGDEVGEPDETFSVSLIPQRPERDVGTSISITIIDDEPKCDPLDNPSDGSVTFTLYQGSMAIYTCDPTYKLIGASTRTCGTNGEWSGNDPLCTRIVCPDQPPSLANGDFTLSSGNVVGSIATYTCDIGYRLNTTAFTRVCQMNEMWSMEDIMCEKVPTEPPEKQSDDGLSGGAIAGIIVGVIIILVILAVLVVILLLFLWMRHQNRSGKYRPSYDTEDQAPKINKGDIGEPVLVNEPEGIVPESQVVESNEMLIN